MKIAKTVKEIDDKGRLGIPKYVLECAGMKAGDDVYFGISKAGNIIVCKDKSHGDQD